MIFQVGMASGGYLTADGMTVGGLNPVEMQRLEMASDKTAPLTHSGSVAQSVSAARTPPRPVTGTSGFVRYSPERVASRGTSEAFLS